MHRIGWLLLATAVMGSGQEDGWEPVRFLVGTWEGTASGEPGQGTSEREYRFVLNGGFLEVRNKSVYPPQPPRKPKGETHEDWGMISYDKGRKRLVLRQFHVEGFVNQYVAAVGTGPLRFDSEAIENIPAGYRARETYTVTGPDEFAERFELAAPGKDFELYSETKFRRKRDRR